jgi:hypothetical protein
MRPLPNRISAYAPLTPEHEMALARELLEIQSEEELDHFLPLLLPAIKLAAPMLMKAAGPLLKSVAGSLFSGGSSRRKRPRDDQEQFLGNIVKGLFGGEMEAENQEQFLGRIVKGFLGGEMEGEEEQFLGSIIGKLFGGGRKRREYEAEGEAENYVQEQFLGGILGKLLGGEMEMETEQGPQRLGRAQRFVRLATMASNRAAAEIMNLARAGRPPTELEVRKIVLRAIVIAARRFTPRVAATAFAAEPMASEGTVLEMMIANAEPIQLDDDGRAASGVPYAANGARHAANGRSNGTTIAPWTRPGKRATFTT